MRKKVILYVILGLLGAWASQVSAQAYFKCIDSAGHVSFSDRRCAAGRAMSVESVKDVDSPQRKAANDARIQRDTTLGNQIQSNRVAQVQARQAAQDSQVQASKGIAATVAQARTQQQSSTQSVLPASTSLATQPPTN